MFRVGTSCMPSRGHRCGPMVYSCPRIGVSSIDGVSQAARALLTRPAQSSAMAAATAVFCQP